MMVTLRQKPNVWAHASTPAGVDALREVLIRAEIIEPSLTYRISVPAISEINESDVTVLQDTGSKSAQNFLKDISPNLCLWTEDSLDTPLFSLNHHVSRPVALINPNIKTLLGRPWIWRKTVMRQFLRPVCYSFAERLEDVNDLRSLGLAAKKIEVIGPLLSGVVAPACDEAERDHIGEILAARPVWFAHKVPLSEIRMVLESFVEAQRNAHRLLLILDLEDRFSVSTFNEISLALNLISQSRSEVVKPDPSTQVFLTDGSSDVGLWYRLASISYMGGSFTSGKVPNPLVAAALGSSVIHGPKVNVFKELYVRMMEGGASVALEREKDLSSKLAVLMAPDQCAEMAKKGWQVVSDGAVAIDRLVDFILDKMNLEK